MRCAGFVGALSFAVVTTSTASISARAADTGTLVTQPVPLGDATGLAPNDSTLSQVSNGLEQAIAARPGARMRANDAALASPASSALPPELAALAAKAAKAAEELDTKSGIRLHRDLIDKLTTRLGDIGDVGPLAVARLSLASLYLATNEQLLAKSELDAAARLRPNAELDLSRWPPNVVEAFTAAQQRVRAEPGANLDVAVEPNGAVVFVDGVRVGESPLSLAVRRGPHVVWSGAPGHAAIVRVVDAAAGSRARIDGSLVAEPSWELAQRLADAAATAKRADAVSIARALGREEHAANVVVTGVVDVPGGVAVLLARADDEPRLAVVTLDAALSNASTSLGQGLGALDQPPAAFSGGVARIRGDHAPDAATLKVDASKWLLGMASTRGAAVAAGSPTAGTPVSSNDAGSVGTAHGSSRGASGGTAVVTTSTPAPSAAAGDDDGFPWFAVGGGAVALVVVAGAAVGAFYLVENAKPAIHTVQDPDNSKLGVTVAP